MPLQKMTRTESASTSVFWRPSCHRIRSEAWWKKPKRRRKKKKAKLFRNNWTEQLFLFAEYAISVHFAISIILCVFNLVISVVCNEHFSLVPVNKNRWLLATLLFLSQKNYTIQTRIVFQSCYPKPQKLSDMSLWGSSSLPMRHVRT